MPPSSTLESVAVMFSLAQGGRKRVFHEGGNGYREPSQGMRLTAGKQDVSRLHILDGLVYRVPDLGLAWDWCVGNDCEKSDGYSV